MLFSSISPNYEQNLLDELWGCFKYIKIPFNELWRMPVKDRKYFIHKHNKEVEEENAEYDRAHGNGQSNGPFDIDAFTDMSQQAESFKR